MGSLVRGLLLPPVPRRPDAAPAGPASQPVIHRLRMLGAEVARLAPDAIVLASARWVTTFHHYVAGPVRLAGVAAAPGAADIHRELPYGYPGDPMLARALVTAGVAAGIPVALTEEPSIPMEDGTVTALRHLVPAGDVPVVPVSLCHLADLAEMLRWGRAIGTAVRAVDRRVVLAVAGGGHSGAEPATRCERPRPDGARDARLQSGPLALLLGALGSGCRASALSMPSYPLEELSLRPEGRT